MFDVNMPLLYGEGEKAFTRLQEEILKEDDDQSIFAWTPVLTKALPNSPNYVDLRDLKQEGCVPIFARHPRNFAQARDIYPQDPLGEPTTITNKGVRIDLPILRMESISNEMHRGEWMHFFLAVLHCGYFHNTGKHPAIILRRFTSESNSHTYMRHEASGTFVVTHDEVRSSDMRQVYLGKRPRTAGIFREHVKYETSSMSKLYNRVNLVGSTEPRIFQLKDDSQDRKDQYATILRCLGWGELA
jgi:hypothetical protein